MRQRDFPSYLVINGTPWDVRFVRRIPDGDPDDVGLCCEAESVIYIKQGQSPEERLRTFWHEAVHAMEMEYDLKITHKLVYALEEPLSRLWLENLCHWG